MEKQTTHVPASSPELSFIKEPAFRIPISQQYRIHKERPFLASERLTTTVLTGGLSPAHDYLVEAAMKSLGLKVKVLPTTTLESFHLGREFSNNGLCNPSYFMVGNLIKYLRELEKSGLSKEEIIDQYVFFTSGCNAPCRFGMLETEYRAALADCGFEGFRILVFQQDGDLNQDSAGNGLELTPEFFLAIVNAIHLGDIINSFGYATRPFEVVPGQTDQMIQKALDLLYHQLETKKKIQLGSRWKTIFDKLNCTGVITYIYRFWDQISSTRYVEALKEIRKMFETIEVDRFRPKVTVKIIGEFWAMTTVGAGNFHMFRFLEQEGAVLQVEPVVSILQFLLSKGQLRHQNRREVLLRKNVKHWWDIKTRIGNYLQFQKKLWTIRAGILILRREFHRLQKAVGGNTHQLIPQSVLQKLASPYYNINIEGSEGYMEIAKNIYYHEHGLSHMVLSLKPFGCMPSTQSDGVQAAVIESNPEIVYLPIETAGEGETNAQSRVLMTLGDARIKAKKELADAKKSISVDLDTLKAYVEQHPELKNPLYAVPRREGVASTAANFIYHVDSLVQKNRR